MGDRLVKGAVDRMVAAMRHRGPDSEGRSVTPFSEVGFRRLSIIDLAGGDQPMSNESDSVRCFLNGEIYNYLELRKDLMARGHQFKTTSDTEVLPHLYEEYGTEMFGKLNGMFAVCLIDLAKQEILLARDRFGVKQLYFAKTSRGVVFASEIKVIFASGLIEPEIDESNILSYLTLFYCPEPCTLAKGVNKLPSGSWMKLKAGRVEETQRYFELPPVPRYQVISDEEAAQRTRELLWQSVRLQLQADVPVGISLSGGIDSSAITCATIQKNSQIITPVALTIHWPDTDPAEVTSARELCKHLNVAHEVIEVPLGDVFNELPLLGWISDEPVADPATYSQFCIARVAAKYVKVLLSGAGGDELFGGYGRYGLPRRLAAFKMLPRAVQLGLKPFLSDRWVTGEELEAIVAYPESRFLWQSHAMGNLQPEERAAIGKLIPGSRNPFANFKDLFEHYRDHDPACQQMIVDFSTYLPEQILTMMDRATMAASIEGRVPFLDNDLVDFAFSLSATAKMGTPPNGKQVLKRAIAQDVSRGILDRKKAGMPSPFVYFLSQNSGTLRQILLARDSYVRSILPEEWLRRITATPDAVRASFRVLYAILVLEIWHKLFIREKIYTRPDMTAADLFKIGSPAPGS